MSSQRPFDPGLQPERTRLAWQRTAISLAVGALVYARVESATLGVASWLCAVLGGGFGLTIGYWSRQRYRYTNRNLNSGTANLPDGLLPLVLAAVVCGAALLALAVTLFKVVRA